MLLRVLCGLFLFRGLPCLVEELIDGGLEFVEVDLALEEPLLERVEGGVGEQFRDAGHDRCRAGGAGSAEVDGVVAERGLEVLAQARNEAVDQGGELMAGRFGEVGRGAVALQVDGQVIVRDGAVGGIGQLFAKGQGATLLDDGLRQVALCVAPTRTAFPTAPAPRPPAPSCPYRPGP